MTLEEGTRFMVLAPVVRGRKGEYGKLFDELRGEGFTRVKVDGEQRRLEEDIELDKKFKHDIAVVVDRLVMMRSDLRTRLADSIETAVGIAEGMVEIELVDSGEVRDLTRRTSPAPSTASRSRSSSRACSRSTRRTAPARAARARLADGDRPGPDRPGPRA